MSKGEYDRALAEYTHALELDPRFANAYNGRAQLYNKKGMLTEGLADAEQALSLDPKSPLAHARAPTFWKRWGGATKPSANTRRRLRSNLIC